ncbi:Carboxylesterase type B [Penicillium macrosclerotiorum]|uniref:Carboxylesterase type B n=1 Tax=Penicillium macrosclerotiorum TaxID=303699 RepID=UPI002549142A|nr:Carboxylesterase type B [Penicillium macrosclerotiorum]KAJ5675840.1 Carboxylesterase type B [Penicillium macrosclerotiorum]
MILLYLCFVLSLAVAESPVIDLGYTSYQGTSFASGISQWLGHGPACIPVASSVGTAVPQGTSEDCLFMDIYAPSNAVLAKKKLPVYFFIQGGGFAENSNKNYNGSGLVQASDLNIVVVTFNYRVGPYGFLAGSEVQKGASLNNGLKDQLKALEWVQKYISKFGGDPDHVVIGGDSAGGASVTLLLSAYGGRDDGLFIGAAAESQSFASMFNVSESQFAYNRLVTRTGCKSSDDTLACLRGLDISTLQAQNIKTPFPGAPGNPLYLYGPTIDGDLIPDYTYRLFHQGKFIKVPVIFGDDTNEGTIFVPRNTSSVNAADQFIKNQFPRITKTHLTKINSMYLTADQTRSFPNAGPYWRPASNGYGEIRYICPGVDMSSVYAAAGVPSWNYHYAVVDPSSEAEGTGTSHTVEVNAIWGPSHVSGVPPSSYWTTNAGIVPVMQGYWTSFVRSLNPNTHRYASSPEWKTWGTGDDAYKRIFIRTNQTRMERVPQKQQERCKYLVSIGEALGQ